MQGVLKQLQEMQRELTALKTQRNVESDDEEEEMFVLDPKVPNVKAPMSQMKRKLGASTKLGQIKGIYDLLVPRDVQAKTSGKGNGRYQSVNADVFKAMERFFSKRFKFETASMIVEAINEKGAQARVHKKKKQSKKTKARKEEKEGNKSETEDEEDEEDEDGDGEEGEDLERKGKDKDKGKLSDQDAVLSIYEGMANKKEVTRLNERLPSPLGDAELNSEEVVQLPHSDSGNLVDWFILATRQTYLAFAAGEVHASYANSFLPGKPRDLFIRKGWVQMVRGNNGAQLVILFKSRMAHHDREVAT